MKVIASDITNLTDARYFAARGVDYLLFDLDKIEVDKIVEIRDWVSGPRILLLFSPNNIHLIEEAIIKIAPFRMGGRNNILEDCDHLISHCPQFEIIYENGGAILVLDEETYRFIEPNTESLEKIFQPDLSSGIVVSGQSESQIGIRSYEQLDKLFDHLGK